MESPDLPGRIADGETIQEAVENGSDALRSRLSTAKEFKDRVPAPSAGLRGKWVQRVPKSLHARLAARAEKEGVSLNTLVVSLIAGKTAFQDMDLPINLQRTGWGTRRHSDKLTFTAGGERGPEWA